MSVASLLRAAIGAHGPLPFSRFMETALYAPECGYYRRDHFGREGDFYTAEQLQPSFGLLLRSVCRELGVQRVVQPGAGRAALQETFVGFEYTPLELDQGEWPARFEGLVLAHEFFDALPVDVAARRDTQWFEQRVSWDGARFIWVDGPPLAIEAAEERVEIPVGLPQELRRIAHHLERGYLLVLDYGYTHRERMRFPQGSLMSYRGHQAIDDVLANPGEQDITAHVPLSSLEELAHELGFHTVRHESMGSLLLRAGEADAFAGIVPEHTLQLKTLLFDLGESFRALLLEKR